MSEKYVVTTTTGLTFSYKERWAADEKAKTLMTTAGELRVPFRVDVSKITDESGRHVEEPLVTFEAS